MMEESRSGTPDLVLSRFIFFFQAEDGIRDLTVTGVQTCALPISPPASAWPRRPSTADRSMACAARPRPAASRPMPAYRDMVRCNSARSATAAAGTGCGSRSEERRVGEGGAAGGSWEGVEEESV